MTDRIAAFLPNFNMPERADALSDYLIWRVHWPLDLYLVDNGSDISPPALYTNVALPQNVQTTAGWLAGMNEADKSGKEYFAYLFLTTSIEFVEGDPISPMVKWLQDHPDAVGIQPAATADSTGYWEHLKTRGGDQPRQTWMIDNGCSLYRANWLNFIGRFDPALYYSWGVDLETCYKARSQWRTLWVDERVRIRSIRNIAYTLERMHMTADKRQELADANMRQVLLSKYGETYWEKMTQEKVTPEMV
jgi:hypothetical protein